MQADYFYPSGIAGEKFFKHLMQSDTFLANKCPKCSKIYCPPRLYCEDCYVDIPNENWKELPPIGSVKLFTVAKLNAHNEKLANPKIVALVNIDGTDSLILSIIGSNDVHKDFTGVKVKAVMKPKGKREGTIKDILYFEEI
jgi:uncharacterized OB-fold protein